MNRLRLTDVTDRTLVRALQLQAQQAGDTIFLRRDEERISFHEAHSRSNALANGLRNLSVGPGDRVAIFMKSNVETILLTFAVNKLGAVWTPINTDYKGQWLEELLNACRPRIIVTDSEMWPRLREVLDRVRYEHLVIHQSGTHESVHNAVGFADLLKYPRSEIDFRSVGYGDTSALMWTSGTTGKSKGVLQPHNIWIMKAESYESAFETRPGDVIYSMMPLYNSGAWGTNVYRALVEGITCALDPQFSVRSFWDRIRYYDATQTFTLGAMHIFLWQAPEKENDASNPLRAAAMVPMPEELIAPFSRRFGIETICQRFGQSEAALILHRVNDRARKWKPNALGEPYPGGVEVKLLDDAGIEVAAGEVGEFCVKPTTPFTLFNGYFDNPEATKAAYVGDWYRTGDLGMRDSDGDYFFVDRKRDAIRYKGRNISTLEVEAAVRRHPVIADVAAFGIRASELCAESELKVSVILRPGAVLTPEDLARFINDTAPYYFVPRYIEFVEELPYTPTKKLQKYLLRTQGVTPATWDLRHSSFKVAK